MQQIFDELREEDLSYHVEILGVNWSQDDEFANDLMTEGRNLPWLQDTLIQNVRDQMSASYRDVIILDPLNREQAIRFNLTTSDLALATNREVLKKLLRNAAVFVDEDDDGIADYWEQWFFGAIDIAGNLDADNDGADQMIEYGLGSDPLSAQSIPSVEVGLSQEVESPRVTLTFRRRLGLAGGLHYLIEASEEGEKWSDQSSSFRLQKIIKTFDGTGTEIVTFQSVSEFPIRKMFRVRVLKD